MNLNNDFLITMIRTDYLVKTSRQGILPGIELNKTLSVTYVLKLAKMGNRDG